MQQLPELRILKLKNSTVCVSITLSDSKLTKIKPKLLTLEESESLDCPEIIGYTENLEDLGIQFHNPICEATVIKEEESVILEIQLYPSTNEDISKLTNTLLNWAES